MSNRKPARSARPNPPLKLDGFQEATIRQIREAGGKIARSMLVMPQVADELKTLGLVKIGHNKLDPWSTPMVSLV